MGRMAFVLLALNALMDTTVKGAEIPQWEVFEASYETGKAYSSPFTAIEVNVVFQHSDKQWIVPAFWAGSGKWTVRFAPQLLNQDLASLWSLLATEMMVAES